MNRRVALYVALGLLGVYLLGRWDASQSEAVGSFVEQATRALEAGKAFRARQGRLQAAALAAAERAATASRRANALGVGSMDSLRREIARLGATEPVPRPVVDSLLQVADQRDSLRLAAIASLTVAVAAERQRAAAAEARVSQLEKTLAVGVKVADCHIAGLGFLPRCPSRTASLVLGAGLGATAVILAR